MVSRKCGVYDIITERMIAQLERGTVPWHKPWAASDQLPANLTSGKAYRGVNPFMLGMAGYASPYWVTFKQARQCGGTVRKGEHGWPVIFWKWVERDGADRADDGAIDAPQKRYPILRYYTVFNVAQCEGIEHARLSEPEEPRAPIPTIARAERIAEGYQQGPSVEHGSARSFYRPSSDSVHMPDRDTFETAQDYYSVLFHELTHSTGHASRLGRKGVSEPQRFGNHEYSREELVAEMGAAFLRHRAGITHEPTEQNSAAYLDSWIQVLKGEPRMLVQAGAQAQKAADHILGAQGAQQPADAAEAVVLAA